MAIRLLAIFSVSLVWICLTESAPTAVVKARQFLYAKPGYVPVYIWDGDTPLEDINPDLAEAFNSYAQKHGRITYGRQIGLKFADKDKDKVKESKLDDSSVESNSVTDGREPQHIQKIPRT